jgi:hypothetical protein
MDRLVECEQFTIVHQGQTKLILRSHERLEEAEHLIAAISNDIEQGNANGSPLMRGSDQRKFWISCVVEISDPRSVPSNN